MSWIAGVQEKPLNFETARRGPKYQKWVEVNIGEMWSNRDLRIYKGHFRRKMVISCGWGTEKIQNKISITLFK